MGSPDIGDPVPKRLVHGVLQGPAPGEDLRHLGSEESHAYDVCLLATDVFRPHVDYAGNPPVRTHRRGGNAVLSRPRFSDDPAFPRPFCKKDLPEGIVDLVGPRKGKIFPFEEYFRPLSLRITSYNVCYTKLLRANREDLPGNACHSSRSGMPSPGR